MGIKTGRSIVKQNLNDKVVILDFLASQVDDVANPYLIGLIYDGKDYIFRSYDELMRFFRDIKLTTVVYIADLVRFKAFFRHKLYSDWKNTKANENGKISTINIVIGTSNDGKKYKRHIVCRDVEVSLSINVDKDIGSYLDTKNVKTFETELEAEDYDLLNKRLNYIAKQIKKYGFDNPECNIVSPADFSRQAVNKRWEQLPDEKKEEIITRHKVLATEWTMINDSFQGGLAVPNTSYLGKNLYNVTSYDINSAYPCAMANCKLPYKRVTLKEPPRTIEDFLKSGYGSIIKITFNNLAAKNPNVPTLNIKYDPKSGRVDSSLKAKNLKVWNKTHVISADELRLTITFLDLYTINRDYTYDGYTIHNAFFYEMRQIEDFMRDVVMEQYEIKANAPKGSNERDLAKKILNSLYGITMPTYINYKVYDESDVYRRFYRAWATFITAWVRYSIAATISKLGDDFVYSDTDSIKFLNADKHKDLFNVGDGLGQWKDEGTYELFKIFNTKSYMYIENGKLELKFSGLDGEIKDRMIKAAEKNGRLHEIVKAQDYGLFSADGHIMRQQFSNDIIDKTVTDMNGKKIHIIQKGYELIRRTKFSIDEPQIKIVNIKE